MFLATTLIYDVPVVHLDYRLERNGAFMRLVEGIFGVGVLRVGDAV